MKRFFAVLTILALLAGVSALSESARQDMPLASARFVLGREADMTENTQDGIKLRWSGVSSGDYGTFGEYLGANGYTLAGWTIDGDVLCVYAVTEEIALVTEYDRANQTLALTYPEGTAPETEAGCIGTLSDMILPRLSYVFGVRLPSLTALAGARAAALRISASGETQLEYTFISDEDWQAFLKLLADAGCTVESGTDAAGKLSVHATLDGAGLKAEYDADAGQLTLIYDENAYPSGEPVPAQEADGSAEPDALTEEQTPAELTQSEESVFEVVIEADQTVSEIPENTLPNPEEALMRIADTTAITSDGRTVKRFSGINGEQYKSCRAYLEGHGCTLENSMAAGKTSTLMYEYDGKAITLQYDSAAGNMSVSYEAGCVPFRPDYTNYIVVFGSYEQDNNLKNGSEPIQWRVYLDNGDSVRLISVYSLDCQQYNTRDTAMNWENSTLRAWLNDAFYNAAFTQDDKARINVVLNDNSDSPGWGTGDRGTTEDTVYLLSKNDLCELYCVPESERRAWRGVESMAAAPTEYAKARGAYSNQFYKYGWWWLRTGGTSRWAQCVYWDGVIYSHDLIYRTFGVRPAIELSL